VPFIIIAGKEYQRYFKQSMTLWEGAGISPP
jgi:hypothetical protein